MASRDVQVRIVGPDLWRFRDAYKRAAAAGEKLAADLNRAAAVLARFTYRPSALDSPGDQHIDRVCRQIATGVPGRDPALRLQVAADLAEILDRSNP